MMIMRLGEVAGFVLVLVAVLIQLSNAHISILNCDTSNNYTAGSGYETNLKSLLQSFPSKMSEVGFYNSSMGLGSDQVYALLLCRGDLSSEDCYNCSADITTQVFQRCPSGKTAIAWLDRCLLHFADTNFFGKFTKVLLGIYSLENASNVTLFHQQWRSLMDNLSTTETSDPNAKFFAVGWTWYDSFTKIYGMVQCTRDLNKDTCTACFDTLFLYTGRTVLNGTRGGQVYADSCFLRYENYLFYSTTEASPPPPPPPLPPAAPPSLGQHNKSSKKKLIIIVSVSVASTCLLCIFSLLIWRRKAKGETNVIPDNDSGEADSMESAFIHEERQEFLLLDLSSIKVATNNFSKANMLGEGGYGPVYKGCLPDGQEIAVKKLSRNSGQGAKEFKNEVQLVAKLQHRNLVRLLGCCLEQGEKILVYEYVPNTSLDKLLFDSLKAAHLDWWQRAKIIVGIARGLLYLHEDSRLKIIHRDLKASNILLDKDMNAKVDFGLAKLVKMEQSYEATSKIAGTYGYMAPEYITQGQFSVKSDVFSFGVLILEIVAGRRNGSSNQLDGAPNLLSYAFRLWKEGKTIDLIDEALRDSYDTNEALRCVHIGLLCVQDDPAQRPTISSVIVMLSSRSQTLQCPSAPAFCRGYITGTGDNSSNTSADNASSLHAR